MILTTTDQDRSSNATTFEIRDPELGFLNTAKNSRDIKNVV